MEDVSVRFASLADLDFVGRDHYLSADALKRKISDQEVLVAERGGQPVGYLRLEYLWALVPYVALIHVLPDQRRLGGHAPLYSSSQADEPEPQAWHRHMGFEECRIISGINDGGVGEVFFCKRLR